MHPRSGPESVSSAPGFSARSILQIFTQLLRQERVAHVVFADAKPEVVAKQAAAFGVRGYTDYREMLAEEQLDGVTVVTPDFAHRPVALQALARAAMCWWKSRWM